MSAPMTTRPLPFPFTKREMLLILAKTVYSSDETDLEGNAFVQRAFEAVTAAMRRQRTIPAGEVDAYIALAKANDDNVALFTAVAMLAAELPDDDYRAAMAGVLDQDIEWMIRASHAPAGLVQ